MATTTVSKLSDSGGRIAERAPYIAWPTAFTLSGLLLAQAALPIISTLTSIFLIFWALCGTKCALQALSGSVLLTFLNPALFPTSEAQAILKWGIYLAGVSRIFFDTFMLRYKLLVPHMLTFLLLFVLAAFSTSMIASAALDVSLFKLIVFFLGASAILLGFEITHKARLYWESWFLTLFYVVIVASLPTLFWDDIGRLRNGEGFQGILNHPQALGTFLAPMVAWITGMFLSREKGISLTVGIGGLLGWVLLFGTQARTAFLSVSLALISTILLTFLIRRDWLIGLKRTFVQRGIGILIYFAVPFAVIFHPIWQPALSSFLLKNQPNISVQESFEISRGLLIKQSFENFAANPWLGIGFGVPSNLSTFNVQRDPIFGFPIGAPIEKGFIVSAILEEVGTVGAFFFVLLIASLLVAVVRKSSFAIVWMFLACLFVNIGEMIFFSLGGLGLYTWLLIGLSTASCYDDV